MTESNTFIIIDDREPHELVEAVQALEIDVKVMQLYIADVTISEKTCIEIKRVKKRPNYAPFAKYREYNDFIASQEDNRLYRQARDRRDNYECNFVIIELEPGADLFTKAIPKQRFDHMIQSMAVYYHSVFLYSSSTEETAQMIADILARDIKGDHYVSPINKRPRPATLRDEQINMVAGLLDVSDKKANVLLDIFKSPWEILTWIKNTTIRYTKGGNPKLAKDQYEIKGFGPKFFLKNQKMLVGIEENDQN